MVTGAQRRLLSRDGQLRQATRGQPPRRASSDGRRVGKVKGTSGAAGQQGVRALRLLAALKRQAALRRCQPGDLILYTSGQSPFGHLCGGSKPRRSQGATRSVRVNHSGVNPARHGGGWGGARNHAVAGGALRVTKPGRWVSFGILTASTRRRLRPAQHRGFSIHRGCARGSN